LDELVSLVDSVTDKLEVIADFHRMIAHNCWTLLSNF